MEDCYRVFVGGLFSTVKEEDLRDRFGSFGEVKDVKLIQRKNDDNFVSKTFGYVTLKTTLQKLNKCFALFGGTKWNGHDLKVQLAKEDFMARLEKEWREPEKPKKLNKRKIVQPTKTYNEILESSAKMKKALPGTLIEGEKNWVMGKYGRPLPVVYIKNLTGKKLLKVDPSKHCHCLRKINLDVDERSIEHLSWSFEDEKTNDTLEKKKINDTLEKKKKNEQEVLQNGSQKKQNKLFVNDAVETPFKNSRIQEKAIDLITAAKKMNVDGTQLIKKTKGPVIPAEENNHNETKICVPDILDAKEKDRVDFLQLTIENDTKTNKNMELKADISKAIQSEDNDAKIPSLSSMESCEKLFEQYQLSDSIVSQLVRNNFKSQINVEANNIPTYMSNNDTESDEDVCFDVNPFDFSFDSLLANNKDCSKNSSSDSPTYPQSIEINKAQSIDNKSKRSSYVDKNDKKKLSKNEKHAFSDQQRLLALERKNKSVGKCKDLIKQALENIDNNLSTHIKFKNEDQEDFKNAGKKDVDQQNKKFNLFGSDEESADENELFRLKPQFQGEEGEKLFKLHQKFSTDQRFKLDERFAEEKYDHITKDEHDSSDTLRSDALENDLKKEMETNLSVLESILGISLESDRKKKSLNNFRLDRYDPSNEDKSKYEYQLSTDEVKSPSSEEEEQDNASILSPNTQPPLVSKETFYKVDESLKDLFQGKSKDTAAFSFLGLSADNNNEIKNIDIDGSGIVSEKKQLSWKKALEVEKNLEDDFKDTDLVQYNDLVPEKERFFFVTDDDRFKLGKTFVRSSTVEEINEQWIGIRSKLHEAYKKNHKDALRRKFKHRKKF